MSKFPHATIIIVHYNCPLLIKQTLQALARQTLTPHRIIIVDNASEEHLPKDIGQLCANTEIIYAKKNLGFAAANNLAASKAEDCEWIILLNPDAFPEHNWLENLLAAALANPQYVFFACRLVDASNPQLLDGTGDVYHVSGRVWRRDFGKPCNVHGKGFEEIFSPCGAAAMYRRDIYLKNGGLDENYFCYLEDIDLGFRLQLQGYRCLYVPNAVVHHIGSATTKRHSDFYVYHGHRNLLWTYCKNMPTFLFILYFAQHFLLNLATIIKFFFSGQGKIIIKAKRDALAGLPRIWQQRKGIQRQRKVTSWQLRRWLAKGLPRPK